MVIQELAPSSYSNSINDLVRRFHSNVRESDCTWNAIAVAHAHDIGRAGSVDYAQGMLVRLISMRSPRHSLPVVAELICDLHDKERENLEQPYDIEMLRSLGLLMSASGTKHFDRNQRHILDLAAVADLEEIGKLEQRLFTTGDNRCAVQKLQVLQKDVRKLEMFRSQIYTPASVPTTPGMRK